MYLVFFHVPQDFTEADEHTTRDDYQASQSDINSLSSHSIWSPVQPKGPSVGGDGDVFEGSGWDNSNSASSSRSSSRLELSSIMENEKNATTSSFLQTSPPSVSEGMEKSETDQDYQSSWLSTRGAHSAPSSPSPVRSRDQRMKLSRPVTAQSNSYDDMSDRLWSRRTSDEPSVADMKWATDVGPSSSATNVYQNHLSDSGGDHGNVLNSSAKLGSFKQYETTGVNKWNDPLLDNSAIADVRRLLERLSLSKYKQTFEVN